MTKATTDQPDPKNGKSKEEQQRRVLEYQHFDLKKFKVTKDGVDVTHHENAIEPLQSAVSGEYQPHPDLKVSMDKLQLYMATRLGLLLGWDHAREHLGLKKEDALAMAVKGHEEAVERCNVNGLTFVGEGETAGVMITGSVKLIHGGSFGLAVPKITFGKTVLGYEDDVQEICEEIKKEVYAYRFQSKKLQLDLDTELKKKVNPEMFGHPKENSDQNELV